jgi:hypothetical protein
MRLVLIHVRESYHVHSQSQQIYSRNLQCRVRARILRSHLLGSKNQALWRRDCEMEMLSEIATIRVVNARTSIPVHTVFACNCDANNPFGYPYMLMGALLE